MSAWISALASSTTLDGVLPVPVTVAPLVDQLDDVRDGYWLVAEFLEVGSEARLNVSGGLPTIGFSAKHVDDLGVDRTVVLAGPALDLLEQLDRHVPDMQRGHIHDASTVLAPHRECQLLSGVLVEHSSMMARNVSPVRDRICADA